MPITGLKTGDQVLTPGGQEALVWEVVSPMLVIVRVEATGAYATFRQSTLRKIRRLVSPRQVQ